MRQEAHSNSHSPIFVSRLERRHVARASGGPGSDDVSDDDSEEAGSSEGSEGSDSDEKELVFEGWEEERQGHNHLNSSLRGFYDAPKESAEEGVGGQNGVQREGAPEQGEGTNRSAPPAETSGRGVDEQGVGSGFKAGGKRKRDEKDVGRAGTNASAGEGRDSQMGAREGLHNPSPGGVSAELPRGEAALGQQNEGAVEQSPVENGHQPIAANQRLPPRARAQAQTGQVGNNLRRGRKFVRGAARGGGGERPNLEEARLTGEGGEAPLGASQPKRVWFKDLGGIEGTLDAIRELIL